jgi:SAM-dependent methyltransferase
MGPAVAQNYALKPSPYSSHSLLLSLLPQTGEGRKVLDLGCWDGLISRPLAERGFQVTGLDVQPFSAENTPSGFEFIQADLHRGIPDLGMRFDYVICADVLEHLLHPDLILRQARGLLRPGGQLLASLPNSGNLYFRLVVLSGRFPKQDKGLFDRTHLHFFTRQGWRELFESCQYELVEELVSGIPVSLTVGSNGPVVQVLESVSHRLAALWKSMFAYQFIFRLKARHE